MTPDPLLSKNPFRLLGLPSETPLTELRRSSEKAEKRARAGIFDPPPLSEEFGTDDIGSIANATRALSTDPERLTLFRLFWPLQPWSQDLLDNGGRISSANAESPSGKQALFLEAWVRFVTNYDSTALREALAFWDEFYGLETADQMLAELLSNDEQIAIDEALDAVYKAQRQAIKHLLQVAFEASATKWEAGSEGESLKIARVALESPLDDDEEEMALSPLIRIGDNLAKEVDQEVVEILESSEVLHDALPTVALRLKKLSDALGERHPSVNGWNESIERCSVAIQARLRVSGQEIASRWQGMSSREPHERPVASDDGGIGARIISWIVIIGIGAAIRSGCSSSGSNSSPESSSPYSSGSSFDSRSFEQPGSPPYVDTEREARLDRLEKEYEQLKRETDQLSPSIDETASDLDTRKDELRAQKAWLDGNEPNPYAHEEVDSYNTKVDEYESLRRQFNEDIRRHNERVNSLNRKVRRLKQVAEALSEGGR
ncbi:MAG: hypothetical protein UZ18_ATM001002068 [Armatimonadetes bacterium OLB18]|nr:MAG: hypothetical protein UZ18_ATM001002068 [Armatimonadetes bacterium OLB18]